MLQHIHTGVLVFIAALAIFTFYGTMKQVNPYGRYAKPSDRNTMTARPAWLLFESPQWWSFAVTFWLTAQSPGRPGTVRIGRARCREGVCKSVWISGGA